MALWKITVKNTRHVNGVELEKGMSVEIACSCNSAGSVFGTSENKPKINDQFKNKYGIDLSKANLISSQYLDCEKMN